MTRRAVVLALGAAVVTSAADAQAQEVDQGRWRVGASTGAYVPSSALIQAADAQDTRLEAGPAFALEVRYLAAGPVSVYASGLAAFSTIRTGSAIQPAVVGSPDHVMLVAGTAGVVLAPVGWLGEHLQPTLRLGGGFKAYAFDLTNAEDQVRPSADIGVGFRSVGGGAIEVAAEVRYLSSTFDQGKLPIRGIAPQEQRQSDLVLTVGFAIRP